MIVDGCYPLPASNSNYQCLVFDHHIHLVGNYSDHYDTDGYHYGIPFDNSYHTYPRREMENYLGMTESIVPWQLILLSRLYSHCSTE